MKTLELIFDGKKFKITSPIGDIKTLKKILYAEIEQYIIEKWLDKQADSKRMTHDQRMKYESKDIEKLEREIKAIIY